MLMTWILWHAVAAQDSFKTPITLKLMKEGKTEL